MLLQINSANSRIICSDPAKSHILLSALELVDNHLIALCDSILRGTDVELHYIGIEYDDYFSNEGIDEFCDTKCYIDFELANIRTGEVYRSKRTLTVECELLIRISRYVMRDLERGVHKLCN